VFDLLTRPGPDLARAERDEVKKVARDLLQRVRGALALNRRQKTQARAQVKLAVVFEHVFETLGDASSVALS
jgi:type I restriction enzyme, R subunit